MLCVLSALCTSSIQFVVFFKQLSVKYASSMMRPSQIRPPQQVSDEVHGLPGSMNYVTKAFDNREIEFFRMKLISNTLLLSNEMYDETIGISLFKGMTF